jgi:hypothetical protein
MKLVWLVARMGDRKFVKRSEGKKRLGKPILRREDNIKMDRKNWDVKTLI